MEKAIAVVVTYNRETLLKECIDALRNQSRKLDAILVINNGSTDATEAWLKKQDDIVYITQENVGSAGGFSTGINWAYKNKYSWIWCMDDDGYPKEDAFENLMKADNGQLRLLNCAVIDKEDKKSFVWKTMQYSNLDEVDCELIEGKGHPFNGTLLHRKIVERVGLPNAKFFLWGDETEYYYRITRQNKIPVFTVANSIHYHPSAAFSIKEDWNFTNAWKMYYYVRNRYFIQSSKFSNKYLAMLHYICFLSAYAGIILFYQKTDKLNKLKFMYWPVADTIQRKFTATPTTILQMLKVQQTLSFRRTAANYLRNSIATLFVGEPVVRSGRTANA